MIHAKKEQWIVYRIIFWMFCGSCLFSTFLQSFDWLYVDDVYTLSGPLEEVYFSVGRRGHDVLYLTVDGQRSELYCAHSRKQAIFESILDQCGVEYVYDPDYVGETVEAAIENGAICELKLVSTFSREELILGLTFDGEQYCSFDAAYSGWKEHAKGTAAAFPVCLVLVLLGNRFFKKMMQR